MTRTTTAVLSIVAVETGGKLDCCDTDTVHVWVIVSAWSPRRAYLTGARPFLNTVGCAPHDLVHEYFTATVPVEPPEDIATAGERLEWQQLEVCPPLPPELAELAPPPPNPRTCQGRDGHVPHEYASPRCRYCGAEGEAQ
ncbi:hypothetical protein ACQ86D_28000 [Streptomyces galilaeus]